jgi:hypothetical protein
MNHAGPTKQVGRLTCRCRSLLCTRRPPLLALIEKGLWGNQYMTRDLSQEAPERWSDSPSMALIEKILQDNH